MCMPTNLAIDDRLLDQARSLGGYRTKRETVNEALREFIQQRQRRDLGLLDQVDRIHFGLAQEQAAIGQ